MRDEAEIGQSGRMIALWRRVRMAVIGSCVTFHFVVGTLCFAKAPSGLLEIPFAAALVDVYERFDFAQTWRMFAPPSQTIDELGYALRVRGGWTPMQRFDQLLRPHVHDRFTLPRGFIRVADHVRHPFLTDAPLIRQPFFFHYFQQLGAFFCKGRGAIPGLERIRFYSIVRGVPPFFTHDGAGHPLPTARDYDKVEALYERACEAS